MTSVSMAVETMIAPRLAASREIVQRGDIQVVKIATENNLADPFTKALSGGTFDRHMEGIGVRCIKDSDLLSL